MMMLGSIAIGLDATAFASRDTLYDHRRTELNNKQSGGVLLRVTFSFSLSRLDF
jgi:hypothetical protein